MTNFGTYRFHEIDICMLVFEMPIYTHALVCFAIKVYQREWSYVHCTFC